LEDKIANPPYRQPKLRERISALFKKVRPFLAANFPPEVERFTHERFFTVGHAELHTDVGGYDESRGISEAKEVLLDRGAIEKAMNWARETFRGLIWMEHGAHPSLRIQFPAAALKWQFGTLPNEERYLEKIIVRYLKPKNVPGGGTMVVGIVDIVEGYPIPGTWEELEKEIIHKYGQKESAFMRSLRRLKVFPRLREAYEGFMPRLFAPIEHEELHTDIGAYDESRLAESSRDWVPFTDEEYMALQPGDPVVFNPFNAPPVETRFQEHLILTNGAKYAYIEDPSGGDGYWSPSVEHLGKWYAPEHEELHTDVGAYDESIMARLKA
jgi:hypothetical protein